jgi:hypothetical protein
LEDFADFARLITALRPWIGQLVVVGGWAHRLHRFHPLANPPAHLPLRTRDADLAFSRDAALDGNVRAALVEAGFKEELLGDHRPPVAHYRLENEGLYAEFLTSLHGDGLKRNGTPGATVTKAGITAQKLRYLDLLLSSAWGVRVGPHLGVPVANDVELLVPNPVSFIVQKLLIHSDRNGFKKAQDVLYIHDTLELFGPAMDELRRLWTDKVRPAMPSTTAARAVRIAIELFQEVTDPIREAARMPLDRQPEAEHIQLACEYGLGQILGPRDSA